ncbi:MAG: hypothetical protein AAF352_07375 [Pseudomonadota bacterium]
MSELPSKPHWNKSLCLVCISILQSQKGKEREEERQQCLRVIGEGVSAKDALSRLRPRVFFKYEQAFIRQLQLWRLADLRRFLQLLIDCEKQGKWQYAPQNLLAMRLFHQICATAKRQGQR